MDRQFQDDLASVNSARLRALGVIKPDAVSATIRFGEGERRVGSRGSGLASRVSQWACAVAVLLSALWGEGADPEGV